MDGLEEEIIAHLNAGGAACNDNSHLGGVTKHYKLSLRRETHNGVLMTDKIKPSNIFK